MSSFQRVSYLCAPLLFVAASVPALAQATASVSTNSSVKIVQPISIVKDADLGFGTVVRPNANSNLITIDASSGARTISGAGDGALVSSTTSRAAYTVTGEGGQTFSISVPASFSLTSGADTILVNLAASAATGLLSGSLGASGTATFGVGGNFTLPSTQASGLYTGSFTTTVTYN